ncbi:MAG: fasciclin domain-containing protein [Bacteroidales bacterium]|nr:fasciclin domain-containing protein [Bacteroidales bacterium]
MNNLIRTGLLATALSACLTACNDEWDEHYGKTADAPYGTASLYEVLSEQPELSDFCRVLQKAKVFSNYRQTDVTYATLLGTDQFFTVWAPVNGTFNCDSLLALCDTSEGDSLVELHFVKNHVARYSHSIDGTEQQVYMLNGKTLPQDASTFNGIDVHQSNIAARNGLVHIIDRTSPYYHNIYEALVGQSRYQHIGQFLRSYQIDKLDEASSLAKEIVDGKTVYIDSVFYSSNILLSRNMYGVINSEDSTYWMLVPEKELWDSLYAEAYTYFNYAGVAKPDSLRNLYAHYALMQDLVYNPNVQYYPERMMHSTPWTNSVSSISELEEIYEHHCYFDAYGEGGIFNPATWCGQQQCSNGYIYNLDRWPFEKEHLYFYPLKYDVETQNMTYDEGVKNKKLTVDIVTVNDSRVHDAYISVTPATQTDPYYVECEVPEVLSGTYDVYVVFLPRSVNSALPFTDETTAGKRNRRPAKFYAEITYRGTDGESYTVNSRTRYKIDETDPAYYVKGGSSDSFLFDCNLNPNTSSCAFVNDPFEVDSVKLCTFTFPTCSYGLDEATTRLKIKNAISNRETNKYWGVWFIDRVILMPHQED